MEYILYNPLANNGTCQETANRLKEEREGAQLINLVDFDIRKFVSECSAEDKVTLCGGDGTLNHFANDVYGMELPCEVTLYAAGSGNDFLRDVLGEGSEQISIVINEYIRVLPVIKVNGIETHFVNGIGYGIDGMVCEVADQMKEQGKKNINYAGLAIKLLLGKYKCPNATVTVDGVAKTYSKVWLAPAMNGCFYGGGMNVAPAQNRKSGMLSSVVMHGSGKIKTLVVFPSIFKGEHIKHKEMVEIREGKEITVEFDLPTALQIDGETVSGVKTFTANFK